ASTTACFKFPHPVADCLETGCPYATVRRLVRSILYLASCVDLSVFSKQSRPDFEMGIRCVGEGKLSNGCFNQFLNLCFTHLCTLLYFPAFLSASISFRIAPTAARTAISVSWTTGFSSPSFSRSWFASTCN